ncbi:MAG: hypothetical protein ACYCQI_01320 [Gammaproteobacteria bacterium]
MYTRVYVLTTHDIVNQEVYYYKDAYYSHGQRLEAPARNVRIVPTNLDYKTKAITAATHELLDNRARVRILEDWK